MGKCNLQARKTTYRGKVADYQDAYNERYKTTWAGWLRNATARDCTRRHSRDELRGAWASAMLSVLMENPYCPVSGCLMVPGQGRMRGAPYPNAPSLDRIDPRKGYTPGNVRVVCNFVNMAKGTMPDSLFEQWILACADTIKARPPITR